MKAIVQMESNLDDIDPKFTRKLLDRKFSMQIDRWGRTKVEPGLIKGTKSCRIA